MITKRQGIKVLLSLSILIYVGGFIIGPANAQEAQLAPSMTTNEKVVDAAQANNEVSQVENKIDRIQGKIASQEEKTDRKIKELEDLIAAQRDIIDDLKIDLKSVNDKPLENGTTFEVWSGIALAVAAIVLTGVAVVVGIGSFWGYREIKDGANRSAKETAEKVVEKLVPLVVAERTEEEMFRLIDNGRLDSVVDEVMQKIIYKDVAFEDDLPSE